MSIGPRFLALLLFLAAIPCFAAPERLPPLTSASSIDLNRYQGTWYEIEGIPVHWQRSCVTSVEINYRLQHPGRLRVH